MTLANEVIIKNEYDSEELPNAEEVAEEYDCKSDKDFEHDN